MATIQKKSLNTPDEARSFPKAKVEFVQLGPATVARATYEPGWKWSEHVKAMAGTETCQMFHFGYVVSGRLHVVMASDGSAIDVGPGDALVIPPGHDAWVVGDEACVLLDLPGAHPESR